MVGIGSLHQAFQLRLTAGQRLEVRIRLGIGGVDPVQFRQRPDDLLLPLFHIAAHILAGIELRLLGQVADTDIRLWPRLTDNFGIEPRHNAQQGGLAGAIETEYPIFAPGKKDRDISSRIWRLGGTILPTRFIV